MSIEAMKQALEALEVCEQSDYGRNWVYPYTTHPIAMGNVREAITSLRQAIAEADHIPDATKMVEPKREWVGLTDAEKHLFSSWLDCKEDDDVFNAIEAKLKEKNT